MSDCIRCGQRIKAGQLYLHAEYDPMSLQDFLAQPEIPKGQRGWLAKSRGSRVRSWSWAVPPSPEIKAG